ncbi:MAG: P-II family nitrogen regulator [Bacillota bacterium]|nr:P-II family nitrogen regulator [Bacillota bacterium]
MKKIEAYIQPEKLDDVKAVVDKYDLNGISIMQIMGCGNQKGWREFVRGSEIDYNFLQKIKIELVVLDEQVDQVVNSVINELYTGEFGDGKIFIYDVRDAIRVRTKEHGEAAIR